MADLAGVVARLELTEGERAELWRCAREHPNAIARSERLALLGPALRHLAAEHAPALARARIVKLMTVLLGAGTEQGAYIAPHAHPEHTVLLYAQDMSQLVIAGDVCVFDAGDVVYLPPHVVHAVPLHGRQRLSVAMLLEATP